MTPTRPEPPSLPAVYLPRDIAKALHCSEWWVKEQARKGRIPFIKPAGSYRFTAEHFAEIVRTLESRPAEVGAVAASTPRRRHDAVVSAPVSRLTARRPRRARRSPPGSTAA